MNADPRLIHVAEAIRLQHFVTALGSTTTAQRVMTDRPFDPEGPEGQDYLREAAAAIKAWEGTK